MSRTRGRLNCPALFAVRVPKYYDGRAEGVAAGCLDLDCAADVPATWCPLTWHSPGVPDDGKEMQLMTPLDVHATQDRGCWVVRLQDDIDHATVPYWKSVLDLLPRDARV